MYGEPWNRRHHRRDEPYHRVARFLGIHVPDPDDVAVVIDAEHHVTAVCERRWRTLPPFGTPAHGARFPTPAGRS